MERKVTVAMALVACLLAAGVGLSEAAVYLVGDSAGWTIMGSPNYTAWASDKIFHVGDVIMFTYNKNFHNVLEVRKTEYSSCNASTPISTHNSGNDSIVIKSKGHRYFFCGIPGHCALGQRVDIKVSGPSSSAALSIPPTASAPYVAPSVSPTSGGASGAVSTPAGAPINPSAGARLAPKVLAVTVAVFSFATISASGGLQHY
ncbi:mavicyanin-like [Zingiber officinale]|uniref:Phytocyanin domain-containing protein n=1 Tax=Zingiber officinale TaxID=94328 RepID=A0A8J5FPC4_ZINOF|nr:mavicyanin-like [Zingiber officinale]KAG6492383.1 hypothetical protein ZIOFF_047346 [Zingiber officinale]